jgi:hypothetical protein
MLIRLENAECLQAYGTRMLETDWRNVLVVTSLERNNTLLHRSWHDPTNYWDDIGWVCDTVVYEKCDVQPLISEASSWTIRYCDYTNGTCNINSAPVQYCLAEPFTPHCSVRINTTILVVVAICNLVKIASLLTTVFVARFEPIVTLGDAISSFMERPDSFTIAAGALSRADVNSAAEREFSGYDGWISTPYQTKVHPWGRAVGLKRWIVTIIL